MEIEQSKLISLRKPNQQKILRIFLTSSEYAKSRFKRDANQAGICQKYTRGKALNIITENGKARAESLKGIEINFIK